MKRRPGGAGDAETFETRGVRGTLALGRRLARRFEAGDCVALEGQFGAGKTVLVRGIAEGLGLRRTRLVSSPTFVLVREYPCSVPVYHVDLYRMVDPAGELADLGFQEMLSEGIVLIEWADRAADALPPNHWRIKIEITGPSARRFALARSNRPRPPSSAPVP